MVSSPFFTTTSRGYKPCITHKDFYWQLIGPWFTSQDEQRPDLGNSSNNYISTIIFKHEAKVVDKMASCTLIILPSNLQVQTVFIYCGRRAHTLSGETSNSQQTNIQRDCWHPRIHVQNCIIWASTTFPLIFLPIFTLTFSGDKLSLARSKPDINRLDWD